MGLLQNLRNKLRSIHWDKVKGLAAKSFKVSVLLVVIFEVIPNIGEFWYTVHEVKKDSAVFANQEAQNILRLASFDYQRVLERVELLLTVLSEVPDMQDPSSKDCGQFAEKVRTKNPIYTNVGVISKEGLLLCSGLVSATKIYLNDRLYFTKTLQNKRFSIGEFGIGRISKKPTISFGYPLFDANKNVRAVLFATVDLTFLKQLAEKAGLPAQATFFILDENGKYLVRTPDSENLVGKEIQDPELLKKIKSGGEQIFELDRMYASTKLAAASEAGSIYIAVGVPKDVLISRFDSIKNARLYQEVISTIIQVIFAWVAGFLFLWQLKKLDRAATRINQGDLSARTNLKGTFGEIQRLAETFDQLAEHLESENKRLRFLTDSAEKLCQEISLEDRFKRVTEIAVKFFCNVCTIKVKDEAEVGAKSGEGEIIFSFIAPIVVFDKEFGEIIFATYHRTFDKFDESVAADIAAYIGLVVENARLKRPLPEPPLGL